MTNYRGFEYFWGDAVKSTECQKAPGCPREAWELGRRLGRRWRDVLSREEADHELCVAAWELLRRFDEARRDAPPAAGGAAEHFLALLSCNLRGRLRDEGHKRRHGRRVRKGERRRRLLPLPAGLPAREAPPADARMDVRAAVDGLPPGDRRLVEEYFWHGRAFAELAGELGRPPTTVRRQLRRALARLESLLRAWGCGKFSKVDISCGFYSRDAA